MEKNKLSVYITTYNRSKYLNDSIRSVLNQTYKEFNLFILDNHSTDNTKDIVNSFKDERINYICHKENIGGYKNIKFAFDNCKTEYVVVFHDDDIMLPNMLSDEIRYLEANKQCMAIAGKTVTFKEEEQINYSKINKTTNKFNIEIFNNKKLVNSFIKKDKTLVFPCIMYRNTFLKDNNIELLSSPGPSGDVLFYCDIEKKGGTIAEIDKNIMMTRIHSRQDSYLYLASMYKQLIEWFYTDNYYKDIIDNKDNKRIIGNRYLHRLSVDYLRCKSDKAKEIKNLEEMLKLLEIEYKDLGFKERTIFNIVLNNKKIGSYLYRKLKD